VVVEVADYWQESPGQGTDQIETQQEHERCSEAGHQPHQGYVEAGRILHTDTALGL